MEITVNRTRIAPVMILAVLGAAACSDTSPTDIQATPSYATIGGQSFVANFDNTTDCNWIRLSARDDGSFTVTNGRNGFTKSYARPQPPTGESRSGP